MWQWLKRQIANYDLWCQQMGLTAGQKRRCVPYRSEYQSSPIEAERQAED